MDKQIASVAQWKWQCDVVGRQPEFVSSNSTAQHTELPKRQEHEYCKPLEDLA